jgi:hypothetical protein
MAELYQVYGGFAEEHMYDEGFEREEKPKRRNDQVVHHQAPSVPLSSQQQSMPQQQAPSMPQPPVMQQPGSKESFQNMQEYKRYQSSGNVHYTFWDKMSMKRSEVIKLAIFSLVIVLAISLDRISTHYITRYLSDNILTNVQEFVIRLSYPIVVFLLLWIVKAI